MDIQWCGYEHWTLPRKDNTPECIIKKNNLPAVYKSIEKNSIILKSIIVLSVFFAVVSGVYFIILLIKNIFIYFIKPRIKKIRIDRDLNYAINQIEKYQKLFEAGVITKDQFDIKAKELQSVIK